MDIDVEEMSNEEIQDKIQKMQQMIQERAGEEA
jgi:hypothetical protein